MEGQGEPPFGGVLSDHRRLGGGVRWMSYRETDQRLLREELTGYAFRSLRYWLTLQKALPPFRIASVQQKFATEPHCTSIPPPSQLTHGCEDQRAGVAAKPAVELQTERAEKLDENCATSHILDWGLC